MNLAAFTLEVMGLLFRIAAGVVLLGWNNKIDDVMRSAQVAEVNSQTVSPSSHLALRL